MSGEQRKVLVKNHGAYGEAVVLVMNKKQVKRLGVIPKNGEMWVCFLPGENLEIHYPEQENLEIS